MELEIMRTKIIPSKLAKKIEYFQIKVPEAYPLTGFAHHFGVDPGTVHIGLAEVGRGNYINAFQVEVQRKDDPVERILDFHYMLSECFHYVPINIPMYAVIEYAAYGSSQFRQTELAEIRTSAMFWFRNCGVSKIRMIAPNSIRKTVFGNGKTKADEVWENIPADCAAAISCAYASMYLL